MKRQVATGETIPHLIASPNAQPYERWLEPITAPVVDDRPAPQLHIPALEAFAQLQAALQTNTALAQQSVALEEQIRLLLAERIALCERIDLLEAQLAQLPQQTMRGAERQPIPLRPSTELPAALHHERLAAVAFTRRFSRAALSDEETLLSDPPPTVPPSRASCESSAPGSSAPEYTVIARPFARFTDLGGFQEAVQGLPGIRNLRVRRFAQGTLEMRLDYDGDRPLAELLHGMPLPIDEVIQEEPGRLQIRLIPLEDRLFPALS